MHKIYVEVGMQSLTAQTFGFWKVIKNQQEATGSLFQPITGKIATQFVQISGTPAPITGIFYATGLKSLTLVVRHDDIPLALYPEIPENTLFTSCFELFPNATNVKPDFWVD